MRAELVVQPIVRALVEQEQIVGVRSDIGRTLPPMRSSLLRSVLAVLAALAGCGDDNQPTPIAVASPAPPAAAAVVAPAHSTEPSGPPLPDPGSLEVALAKAKADGKPVILELSTTWCEPCKIFARKVLPQPAVQAALAGIAFISYDAEHGSGVAVAARYQVSSFPTFLVVDEAGAVVAQKSGIDPTDTAWFVAFAHKAELAAPESRILDALKAHPGDAKVALSAGRWYARHNRAAEALSHLDAAAAADPKDAAGVGADAIGEAGALPPRAGREGAGEQGPRGVRARVSARAQRDRCRDRRRARHAVARRAPQAVARRHRCARQGRRAPEPSHRAIARSRPATSTTRSMPRTARSRS